MRVPLSPKTLEKKYAELGLPKERIGLLHDYFLCFSNLYGVITVREAWEVFKNYEGLQTVHKQDFIAFSGIVQREEGRPYAVLELKEVYTGETTEDPMDRLIVNNRLIDRGHGKYQLLYSTVDMQQGKPYYMPTNRSAFLAFTEDQLFLSYEGMQMSRFLSRLKTDGQYRDYNGKPLGFIVDQDGNPVAGKRLSDFICYTQSELFDIRFAKGDAQKEKLKQAYQTTALEKILRHIFLALQTGGYLPNTTLSQSMQSMVDYLNEALGVALSPAQFERFAELLVNLNNHSHLWPNCGWRPDELFYRQKPQMPGSISIGPGLKQMFESGKMDKAEFERQLKELGIKLSE